MNWNKDQVADTKPGLYFVTAHDAGRTYLMAGPFEDDHAAALQAVQAVQDAAYHIDGRAAFLAWGTIRIDHGTPHKACPLNHVVELH